MNEKIKIGNYPFVVRDFYTDYTEQLTLGALGLHLLNCSNLHAHEQGFGTGRYSNENYTWVISRLVVDFSEPIYRSESFLLQTWVSKIYHYFLNREYLLIKASSHIVGKAHAVWAMINENDRKPVNLTQFHDGVIADAVYNCSNDVSFTKERINLKNSIPCFEYKVRYGDLDLNKHVNSVKYIEHVLNFFSLDVYNYGGLSRFEIAYLEETFYGDNLIFYKEDIGLNSFYVEIRKDFDKIVCKCRLFFR